MLNVLLKRYNRIHMIGIGGSGMAGIAEVLLATGFRVTGSDMVESEATIRLRSLGAEIDIGHNAENIGDAQAVVYSSAVRPDNVELTAAQFLKIPIIPRAEMLAELMRMKAGVAISGTHGKTTTTSLVGEVLTFGGLDPTVIVGGRLRRIETGVRQGSGEILVAEADEFDQSFLRLTPTLVVILNIDEDHIECYGNFEALEDAFVRFGNSVPFYGRTAVCIDESSIIKVLPRLTRLVVTYGMSPQADVRGEDVQYNGTHTSFTIAAGGKRLGEVDLPLPGHHNVLNALAATAIGLELGIGFESIKTALEQFGGVHRRFEVFGEVNDIMIVDDFAHHPAEIAATLAAAKSGWHRPMVVVFQPHLFSRTQALAEAFGKALLAAETAIILPIYPARETPIEGVTSQLIVDAARRMGHKRISLLPDRSMVVEAVKEVAQPGSMVLTVGAGDVYKLAPMIHAGLIAS
jgi:UDP-N-acetylmuramate--alanine ligase